MTLGTISATNREFSTDSTTLTGMIQIDAVLNPGSSGGVLIDRTGAVIGLTTAIQSSTGSFEGIGYAIPASAIVEHADALIAAAMQDRTP
jgi:S1-C subfamily serine protease